MEFKLSPFKMGPIIIYGIAKSTHAYVDTPLQTLVNNCYDMNPGMSKLGHIENTQVYLNQVSNPGPEPGTIDRKSDALPLSYTSMRQRKRLCC